MSCPCELCLVSPICENPCPIFIKYLRRLQFTVNISSYYGLAVGIRKGVYKIYGDGKVLDIRGIK